MRTVGYGGPVPDDGRADLTFNLELVCSQCTSRYARCSDCGGEPYIALCKLGDCPEPAFCSGGGGVRLGYVHVSL